jgi:hypothetical protein
MLYELGEYTGKIFLTAFPIIVIILLDVKQKKRLPIIALFIFGWILYVIPMELRPYFKGNHLVLWWFGIIPNFGCAFALPVIGLKKKSISYDTAKHRLMISSLISFGILLLYEISQLIKGFGTFDWLDITMSILGIFSVNIIFILLKSKFKPSFADNETRI